MSEQLGAKVEWNGDLGKATVTDKSSGTTIELTINQKTAYVNGAAVQLPEPAVIHGEGTLFVPLAFVAKSLGAEVKWNKDERTIEIVKE